MPSPSDPLTRLEVSALSRAAFDELGVRTVGELCARTQLELLAAAYARARDDQRVAPVLAEVLTLLAARGDTLPHGDAPPAAELSRDGAALEGWTYLGSLRTEGAWLVGERRFVGRAGEAGRTRVVAAAGTWDAYERGGYRAKEVELRARGAGEHPARSTSALTLPDPLLAVVDAAHEEAIAPFVRAVSKRVAARGAVFVLAFASRFDLVVDGPDEGPATRLVVRAV